MVGSANFIYGFPDAFAIVAVLAPAGGIPSASLGIERRGVGYRRACHVLKWGREVVALKTSLAEGSKYLVHVELGIVIFVVIKALASG